MRRAAPAALAAVALSTALAAPSWAAAQERPRQLIDARLGGPEVLYAIGRLVIWTPAGSPHSFQRSGLGLTAQSVSHELP
jgi:hypothetical protein